jgi:hypothetical protein
MIYLHVFGLYHFFKKYLITILTSISFLFIFFSILQYRIVFLFRNLYICVFNNKKFDFFFYIIYNYNII